MIFDYYNRLDPTDPPFSSGRLNTHSAKSFEKSDFSVCLSKSDGPTILHYICIHFARDNDVPEKEWMIITVIKCISVSSREDRPRSFHLTIVLVTSALAKVVSRMSRDLCVIILTGICMRLVRT